MKKKPTKLYRHYAANGALLYVGISLSAIVRLHQHRKSPWFDEVARVEIRTYPNREEAKEAETNAIRREKPKHNNHHNNQQRNAMSPEERLLRKIFGEPIEEPENVFATYPGKKEYAA